MYNIPKPTRYDNFYVFDNSTISNIHIADCNDTINGICETTNNVEECIEKCKNGNCSYGYFISPNVCVPLNKTSSSIYYRLRNKDIYPELEDKESIVFSSDSFPPNDNILYYRDNFVLENGKYKIGLDDNGNINQYISFRTDISINLTFLPVKNVIDDYVPIYDGADVVINIPNTGLVLKKDIDSSIMWSLRASQFNSPSTVFQIFKKNKESKYITYDDDIYFTYQGLLVLMNTDNLSLELKNISLENAIANNLNIYFKIKPKVVLYDCKNGCIETKSDTIKGFYRYPSCWNNCENNKLNLGFVSIEKNNLVYFVFFILFVICLKIYIRK